MWVWCFKNRFILQFKKVKNELRRYLTYTVRLIAPLKIDIMIIRDIYIYMYVYKYTDIYFKKHMSVYVYIHIYICLRMFICTYIYVFV